jgi:hypothetical protein
MNLGVVESVGVRRSYLRTALQERLGRMGKVDRSFFLGYLKRGKVVAHRVGESRMR